MTGSQTGVQRASGVREPSLGVRQFSCNIIILCYFKKKSANFIWGLCVDKIKIIQPFLLTMIPAGQLKTFKLLWHQQKSDSTAWSLFLFLSWNFTPAKIMSSFSKTIKHIFSWAKTLKLDWFEWNYYLKNGSLECFGAEGTGQPQRVLIACHIFSCLVILSFYLLQYSWLEDPWESVQEDDNPFSLDPKSLGTPGFHCMGQGGQKK